MSKQTSIFAHIQRVDGYNLPPDKHFPLGLPEGELDPDPLEAGWVTPRD